MIAIIKELVVDPRRSVVWIIVAMIAGLNGGCVGSDSGSSGQTTPTPKTLASHASIPDQSKPVVEKPGSVEKVRKAGGWIKVNSETSRVKLSRRAVANEYDVFVSTVEPSESPVLSLRCDSRDLEPQIEERCKEFPFASDYAISEVTLSDFRGRPFCYGVTAARLNNGSRGGLHYFQFSDEDGDGTFETFILANARTCAVPAWAAVK